MSVCPEISSFTIIGHACYIFEADLHTFELRRRCSMLLLVPTELPRCAHCGVEFVNVPQCTKIIGILR